MFKKRFKYIEHTIKHKRAFLKVEKLFFGKNSLRGYLHDIDKVFMYLLLPISIKKIKKLHKSYAKHHMNNIPKCDFKNIYKCYCIIDFESARFSKPHSQMNAVTFLEKIFPERKDEMIETVDYLEKKAKENGYNIDMYDEKSFDKYIDHDYSEL